MINTFGRENPLFKRKERKSEIASIQPCPSQTASQSALPSQSSYSLAEHNKATYIALVRVGGRRSSCNIKKPRVISEREKNRLKSRYSLGFAIPISTLLLSRLPERAKVALLQCERDIKKRRGKIWKSAEKERTRKREGDSSESFYGGRNGTTTTTYFCHSSFKWPRPRQQGQLASQSGLSLSFSPLP